MRRKGSADRFGAAFANHARYIEFQVRNLSAPRVFLFLPGIDDWTGDIGFVPGLFEARRDCGALQLGFVKQHVDALVNNSCASLRYALHSFEQAFHALLATA